MIAGIEGKQLITKKKIKKTQDKKNELRTIKRKLKKDVNFKPMQDVLESLTQKNERAHRLVRIISLNRAPCCMEHDHTIPAAFG